MDKRRKSMFAWLETPELNFLNNINYDNYLLMVNKHIIATIGDIKLDKLTRDNIHSLYISMIDGNYSPSTVHTIRKIIHGALEQAVVEGVISSNPSHKIILPKLSSPEKNALSSDEISCLESILQNCCLDNGILFLLYSGLRIGEMLALKWSEVDLENNLFKVVSTVNRVYKKEPEGIHSNIKTTLIFDSPKTEKSRRIIPLSDSLCNLLRNQNGCIEIIKMHNNNFTDFNLVFPTEKGTAIDPRILTGI